jgi:hypothetical protein
VGLDQWQVQLNILKQAALSMVERCSLFMVFLKKQKTGEMDGKESFLSLKFDSKEEIRRNHGYEKNNCFCIGCGGIFCVGG